MSEQSGAVRGATWTGGGPWIGQPVAAAVRLAREGFATVRLWRERARQRRQLAGLDDRLLRDIGLTRADVGAEVRKPFWRV